jgi:apolipoprotein N-acyltransferase
VTFVVAATGGALVALLWRRWSLRSVLPAGGFAAAGALLVAGPAAVPAATPGGATRVVAIVQGNVPRLGLDFNAQRRAVLDNHVRRTLELAEAVAAGDEPQPDLVIWPENSSNIDPLHDPSATALIDRAVRAIRVPVLVGAVLDGPGKYLSNAAIVWDPGSGAGQRYVKRHPVPFGEYIPLRPIARRLSAYVDRVARDFTSGHRPGVLVLGPAKVGDVICFEIAYDGVVRDTVRHGADLLVVQTNNATFGRSGETEQQLAMARLRAREYGRTVLVASTSGISAVITPRGRVAEQSRVFTRDLLVESVPLAGGRTLATRVGALPEWLIAAAGLLALAWAAVAGAVRRRRE